jgi:Tfp pilus assembly protein PilN
MMGKISAVLGALVNALSLLAVVVYLIWFAASLEIRISLLEQHQIEVEQRVSEVKADLQEILLEK